MFLTLHGEENAMDTVTTSSFGSLHGESVDIPHMTCYTI